MNPPGTHPNPFAGLTIGRSLQLLAGRYGAREALVFGARRWTFAQAVEEIDRAAGRLGTLGLSPGDKVALWYIAANHDPEVFPDPHRFDITRDTSAHEAFGGGGPHFCLGSHLAKLEIKVMFEELLARIPRMELAGDVQRLRSNFINGIKHLPVEFPRA